MRGLQKYLYLGFIHHWLQSVTHDRCILATLLPSTYLSTGLLPLHCNSCRLIYTVAMSSTFRRQFSNCVAAAFLYITRCIWQWFRYEEMPTLYFRFRFNAGVFPEHHSRLGRVPRRTVGDYLTGAWFPYWVRCPFSRPTNSVKALKGSAI